MVGVAADEVAPPGLPVALAVIGGGVSFSRILVRRVVFGLLRCKAEFGGLFKL